MRFAKKITSLVIALGLVLSCIVFVNPTKAFAVKTETVKLNKSNVVMVVDKSTTLKATSDYYEGKFSWSSSNKKVATVSSSGKITAKDSGICTITVKTDNSSAKCKVYVYPNKLYSDDFYTNGVVNSFWSGESSKDIMASFDKTTSKLAWFTYGKSEVEYFDCSLSEYVKTPRSISLGVSKSTVKLAYGDNYTESATSISTDGLLHVIDLGDSESLKDDAVSAKTCVAYEYLRDSKLQIRYYFDKDDILILIGYVKGYINNDYLSLDRVYKY